MRTAQREFHVGDELEGLCKTWVANGCGYGFLAVPGYPDLFVGARNLHNTIELRPGDRVTFEVRMDRYGRFEATDVRLLECGQGR